MIRSYTDKCGCFSSFDTDNNKKSNIPCEKHIMARAKMKPYSEFVYFDRSLCYMCHGYDAVINKTVCICALYDEINKLDIQINTLESINGSTDEIRELIKKYKHLKEQLLDDIDRVRRRRGKTEIT